MFARDSRLSHRELSAGAAVGDWVVESVRARLPHVVVHRARHAATGRLAALELLRPTAHAPSLTEVKRELAAVARLRHVHVAEILDTGELADGHPYLVVDWIAGGSLQTLLDRRRTLGLDEALALAEQIAAALAAAHALGVVHGELHARHVGLVMRGEQQLVKLVGFGLARLSGAVLAPEQRSGMCDRRSDVFALGALVYQMVTGLRPHADPMPPSAAADVPPPFDEAVRRSLRRHPGQRYDTVEAMMRELTAAVAGCELVAELQVSAIVAPSAEGIDAAALDDVARALAIAEQWLRQQEVALVLGGAGAVVATARIPRALEQQRAARAGWVKLASAVQARVEARPRRHPAVRTRVTIRIE